MSSKPRRSKHPGVSRRARRSWRKEHASIAALEGVFVGMFMITSVAIVSTLDDKPASTVTQTRNELEATLHDVLQGLEALPTADRYLSQIERAIGKAAVGNSTDLDRFLQRTLPAGMECRLWLDNGHGRKLLTGPDGKVARESVSASRWYHPTWAYAVAVPSMDLVSLTQPLQVQGFAVSQGALIKEAGVPVEVSVTTSSGTYAKGGITAISDGGAASLYLKNATGQPTLIQRNQLGGTGTQSSPAYRDTGNQSLHNGNFTVGQNGGLLSIGGSFTGDVINYIITLTAPNGTPYPYAVAGSGTASLNQVVASAQGLWNITVTGSITGLLTPKRANLTVDMVTDGILNITIGVRESANASLPAGTKLTVRLPYLFESISATNTTQTGWTNIVPGKTSKDGTIVTAEFNSSLQNAERTFVVRAAPPSAPDALYRIEATLSNGTSAHASFIVNPLGVVISLDNPLRRDPYVTIPKPMAPGKVSTWGVSFPVVSTSLLGLPETVSQVDIRSIDGTPLFASVAGVYPTAGWTLVSPDHIRWNGTVLLLANAVTEWLANTTAVSTRTPFEPGASFPIEFANGAVFPTADQSNTYVYNAAIEPGSGGRGYDIPAIGAGATQGNATLGVNWYARALRVTGNATYTVSISGDVASLAEATRTGLARSRLDFSTTRVHLGEPVTVTPDFTGLLNAVSTQVNSSGGQLALAGWHVNVQIVDPLQPFQPRAEWKPLVTGNSTASKTTLNYTITRDDFYGPHAVLAEATFNINNVVTGATSVQIARLLGVLDVIPDGGQSETSLYWVSLECWMPDWR